MSDKTLLEPGFCYLEVSSCSEEPKTGNKYFNTGTKSKQEEFDDLDGVPFQGGWHGVFH